MSANDYRRDGGKLHQWIGHPWSLTLACNSIKLHRSENRKKGDYLWIDPPWQFGIGQTLITDSASYPIPDEQQFQAFEQSWWEHFRPVLGSSVESIRAQEDGELDIIFSTGHRLHVPGDQTPGDHPDWYDHWYVRFSEGDHSSPTWIRSDNTPL
ncbi:hypothetical protein [Brevifollis gellanilyticus]|uniref:Uncharacterized protein n=1 Tax=Brevifollis gellanilyticus TaxID=748831 RepID=A0A512M2M5_9BACT|nr:hypothetical protein [Brevifollis gellanilyticus]GEP40993.1 hypothetical protein BGE01nite_02840 [Brevifollis gellanilyticus]